MTAFAASTPRICGSQLSAEAGPDRRGHLVLAVALRAGVLDRRLEPVQKLAGGGRGDYSLTYKPNIYYYPETTGQAIPDGPFAASVPRSDIRPGSY
ncbi:hypothetical protein DL764_000209 [Monosporascus ibericus]|uniref:Uncharacterized protein n=1 Tax=Monosporascus ibericus TaxID=155417 RepID=A0A4Q4U003_9PEZI|nr:hypothetical protein DL764_000209 [Monosporascus ibericus]